MKSALKLACSITAFPGIQIVSFLAIRLHNLPSRTRSSQARLGMRILWIFSCITTHGVRLSPNSGSFFNSRRSHLIRSYETYNLAPQAVVTDVWSAALWFRGVSCSEGLPLATTRRVKCLFKALVHSLILYIPSLTPHYFLSDVVAVHYQTHDFARQPRCHRTKQMKRSYGDFLFALGLKSDQTSLFLFATMSSFNACLVSVPRSLLQPFSLLVPCSPFKWLKTVPTGTAPDECELPRTIFAIRDEPPTWPGMDDDDDDILESISDPEEADVGVDDGEISTTSHAASNPSHATSRHSRTRTRTMEEDSVAPVTPLPKACFDLGPPRHASTKGMRMSKSRERAVREAYAELEEESDGEEGFVGASGEVDDIEDDWVNPVLLLLPPPPRVRKSLSPSKVKGKTKGKSKKATSVPVPYPFSVSRVGCGVDVAKGARAKRDGVAVSGGGECGCGCGQAADAHGVGERWRTDAERGRVRDPH
ncbi:hypothetical protein C8R45DRAFT_1159860 [Mycena sanguinolenta]|nr:hypothetical protein C8R45DRAFT_1159860 [Mycena sanguinolenta]